MKTRLRVIGNSHGLILKKAELNQAGIDADKGIRVEVMDGAIVIRPAVQVNTDVSTWDRQFKKALASGDKPESDMWGSGVSKNADKDWRWRTKK